MGIEAICRFEHATKRFPGIIANDDINLEIGCDEVLAIIGENGAGKSTFCKMLTGLYQPDEGEIYISGEKVKFNNPADSMKVGISMVYQERNLIGLMTGAQNICFGREPIKNGVIDEAKIIQQAEELRDKLHLTVPLDVPAEKLGAGAQQLIEIMRAFYTKPKLLILDEPTASLGEGEIEPFLNFIKAIKNSMHISVIFISHKIEEVFAIADKIAVFTDGKCVLTERTDNLTQQQCISAMLRSDKIKPIVIPEKNFENQPTLAQINTATYDGKEHAFNIELKSGEVVGCYGLVGSGRTECFEALYGMRRCKTLDFTFDGQKITAPIPQEMIKKGMVLTPEKRANGILKSLSITDNICDMFLERKLANKFGFIDFTNVAKFTNEVLKKNGVKYSSANQNIAELSGGNMQKIIVGRSTEVENMKLLVLDEPTAGIDIGAKHELYQQIRGLADEENKCIVFISSELDELMAVCDRLYIFADGNVVHSLVRRDFDKATIVETAIRGRRI